jgi:RNA polymerase sigma-70 factor, ECF subfamily
MNQSILLPNNINPNMLGEPVIWQEVGLDSGPKTGDAQGKSGQSLAELTPTLYSELRRLAAHYMRGERSYHTLQTTALVHEAYLRLAEQREVRWENRAQFLGIAAQLMRRILVDYSRRHHAAKRGSGITRVFLHEAAAVSEQRAADVLALDDLLTKFAKIDPEQARLVELRFFAGLTIEEAAEALRSSPATVKRNWSAAKAWLARELRNREHEK